MTISKYTAFILPIILALKFVFISTFISTLERPSSFITSWVCLAVRFRGKKKQLCQRTWKDTKGHVHIVRNPILHQFKLSIRRYETVIILETEIHRPQKSYKPNRSVCIEFVQTYALMKGHVFNFDPYAFFFPPIPLAMINQVLLVETTYQNEVAQPCQERLYEASEWLALPFP